MFAFIMIIFGEKKMHECIAIIFKGNMLLLKMYIIYVQKLIYLQQKTISKQILNTFNIWLINVKLLNNPTGYAKNPEILEKILPFKFCNRLPRAKWGET